MKDCAFIQDKFPEFILNEIDESNAKKVNDHLTECAPCRSQLSQIKELYRFGEEIFADLRNSVELPLQLAPKLEESVMDTKSPSPFRQNLRFKGIAVSILIMLLFLSTYVSPTAAYYGSKIPILGWVFSVVDEGAVIAHEEGFGQKVSKSFTVNGFTLVIDEVIIDQTRTLVMYRIRVPKDYKYDGGMIQDLVLKDQLGFPYRFSEASGRWLPETNEVIGTVEFPPLKSWARKLTFRTTALLMRQGNKNAFQFGSWEVKFNVDPFLAKRVTREVTLNKTISFPGEEFRFTKAILAPSQTTIFYKYKIPGADSIKVDFLFEPLKNVTLGNFSGQNFPNLGRSGGKSPSLTGINGHGELRFGPVVFGDSDKVFLQGGGFSIIKDDLNIRMPLNLGDVYPHQAVFMDGKITIEKVAEEAGGISIQILTGVDKVYTVISAYLEVSGKKYRPISKEEVDKKSVEKAGNDIVAWVQELRFPAIDIKNTDQVVLGIDAAVINIDEPWQVEIPLGQGGLK